MTRLILKWGLELTNLPPKLIRIGIDSVVDARNSSAQTCLVKANVTRCLSLLLLLGLLGRASAQFNFTTNNGALTIVQYTGSGGVVNIPDSVNGLPVTGIGTNAFFGCAGLNSVTIPGSVISIGDYAFEDCTGLNQITLGTNVASIGKGVFWNCYSLNSVTIPDAVTNLGDYAFDYCYNMTSVTIGNGVTSIGTNTFFECASLDSVAIPDSVTSIGYGAFFNCFSLTGVTMGKGVANIGFEAFCNCYSLPNVTLGSGVTNIGAFAFFEDRSLTSVIISSNVTYIGDAAFYYCFKLTSIYFLGNAPSVGLNVFGFNASPTVYYLSGTTGWTNFFAGLPTMLWNPQMQAGDASFGVQNHQFGFNITGSSNLVVVVQAATNLTSPVWVPVSTNLLTGGSSYFSDPQWTNYPSRFYRFSSP